MSEMEDLYIIDMDYFSFPSHFRYFAYIFSDILGEKYKTFFPHLSPIRNRPLNVLPHYLPSRPTITLICCHFSIG